MNPDGESKESLKVKGNRKQQKKTRISMNGIGWLMHFNLDKIKIKVNSNEFRLNL